VPLVQVRSGRGACNIYGECSLPSQSSFLMLLLGSLTKDRYSLIPYHFSISSLIFPLLQVPASAKPISPLLPVNITSLVFTLLCYLLSLMLRRMPRRRRIHACLLTRLSCRIPISPSSLPQLISRTRFWQLCRKCAL